MSDGRPAKRKAALRAASKFENQINASDYSEDGSTGTEISKAKAKRIIDRRSRKRKHTVSLSCLLNTCSYS